ncbi:MAG: hypothetical protein ACR2O8_13305 [Rhizobiaceae bacterium]
MYIRTAALTTALLFSSTTAYSAEGRKLLEQLVALAGVEGTKITWASISEENSDSFTLSDVEIVDDDGEKTMVKTISVKGLKDANGRLTYQTIAFVDVSGSTEEGGNFTVAGAASSDGDWPSDIWEDGLTADEKKQRIRFGDFSLSGIALKDEKVNLALDSIVITNADIPLDYRYEDEQNAEADGDPADPLTFDQFSVVGLNGSGKADNNQNVDFEMSAFSISNGNFPTAADAPMQDWIKLYSALSITGISTAMDAVPVFRMDNFTSTIAPQDAGGTVSANSQLNGLFVNLAAIPDPGAQAVFKEIGYDKVEGNLAGTASYNPQTGRASVYDTSIKLAEMFDLAFDYAITGYTEDVARKFSKAQMEIAAGKDRMQVLAPMLAELSGVKLETFGIELTDQSITGRLLDFQAKQMGTTGDQLAAGAPMMIGMGMGGLNMPALTEMVTSAVGKFLTEKGTLSVRAQPENPVSLVNVVMAGQADPTTIPDMINLKITAR